MTMVRLDGRAACRGRRRSGLRGAAGPRPARGRGVQGRLRRLCARVALTDRHISFIDSRGGSRAGLACLVAERLAASRRSRAAGPPKAPGGGGV